MLAGSTACAAALALFLLAQMAVAQTTTLPAATATAAIGGGEEEMKTLKERLSDKASDQQRIDNCRVPEDRRGTAPRPDCPPRPASVTAATSR